MILYFMVLYFQNTQTYRYKYTVSTALNNFLRWVNRLIYFSAKSHVALYWWKTMLTTCTFSCPPSSNSTKLHLTGRKWYGWQLQENILTHPTSPGLQCSHLSARQTTLIQEWEQPPAPPWTPSSQCVHQRSRCSAKPKVRGQLESSYAKSDNWVFIKWWKKKSYFFTVHSR